MFSDGNFTYTELFCQMTDDEIIEATYALDRVVKEQQQQLNKKK